MTCPFWFADNHPPMCGVFSVTETKSSASVSHSPIHYFLYLCIFLYLLLLLNRLPFKMSTMLSEWLSLKVHTFLLWFSGSSDVLFIFSTVIIIINIIIIRHTLEQLLIRVWCQFSDVLNHPCISSILFLTFSRAFLEYHNEGWRKV